MRFSKQLRDRSAVKPLSILIPVWFSVLSSTGCGIDPREFGGVGPDAGVDRLQPGEIARTGQGGSGGMEAGGEPCPGCSIDGECVATGTARPGNPCQACEPDRAVSDWSNADGAPCNDGFYCTSGEVCENGTCSGPARSCEDGVACNGLSACEEALSRCSPGVNQCATGVCDVASDTCAETCVGCLVDDICLVDGSEQAGNPCLVCDTSRSTTEYSAALGKLCGAEATECSEADTCNADGQCAPNHLPTTTRCGVLPATCANPDVCSGTGVCDSRVAQRVEACDDIDNDCDGANNEGFDLNGDPNNCGRCGHSCLGGACNAGVCQLSILADLGARQFQLKVVGDHIYSSDSGSFNRSIHRLRRDGSSVEMGIGLALGGLRSFDEDGAFFYIWRNFSAEIFLTKCDPRTALASCSDGSEAAQLPLTLDRTTSGSSVVIDRIGHRVFWYNVADDNLYVSPTGSFNRVSLVGTFTSDFIYANDALWGQDAINQSSVFRIPATGDFPSTVATEANAGGFVANSTRLYWISGDHISFISMPFGNGAAPPNAFPGPLLPTALTVDDSNVYWVEGTPTGDVVKRCPVAGCPAGGPVTLTAPIVEALGLAVDDRAVYIAAGTATRVGGVTIDGGVLLVAK